MNHLLIIVLSLFITSCASLTNTSTQQTAWAFKGKVALRNANEATSVNVEWVQQFEQYSIELSGPLGQGAATIEGQTAAGQATFTQGSNVVKAANLNSLLLQTTGLTLPLDHLRYWVRGEPSPLAAFQTQVNATGQINQISQAGWKVSITSFFDDSEALPRKLQFAEGENVGKLIIRQWFSPTNQ